MATTVLDRVLAPARMLTLTSSAGVPRRLLRAKTVAAYRGGRHAHPSAESVKLAISAICGPWFFLSSRFKAHSGAPFNAVFFDGVVRLIARYLGVYSRFWSSHVGLIVRTFPS